MSWLSDNWLTLSTTLGGGAFGWLVSFIYYRFAKPKRTLSCSVSSFPLIDDFFAEATKQNLHIEFTGYGKPIPSLTIDTIAIWNSGTEPIRKSDMPRLQPLAICAAESTIILNQEIAVQNCKSNVSIVRPADRSKLAVDFEYLNAGDGFAVRLWRTGHGMEKCILRGEVIGGEIVDDNHPSNRKFLRRRTLLYAAVQVVSLLFIISSVYTVYFDTRKIVHEQREKTAKYIEAFNLYMISSDKEENPAKRKLIQPPPPITPAIEESIQKHFANIAALASMSALVAFVMLAINARNARRLRLYKTTRERVPHTLKSDWWQNHG